MNEKMRNDALTEEELNKVSGGTGIIADRTVPDYCTPVEVQDGPNNSALCPYDNNVLKNADHSPYFADWLFYCEKCHKWFSKTWDGKWYVSDCDPM